MNLIIDMLLDAFTVAFYLVLAYYLLNKLVLPILKCSQKILSFAILGLLRKFLPSKQSKRGASRSRVQSDSGAPTVVQNEASAPILFQTKTTSSFQKDDWWKEEGVDYTVPACVRKNSLVC